MLLFLTFLLVCGCAAFTGYLFPTGTWYEGLRKPTWTPPNRAFPIVWTTLYILMAFAGARIATFGGQARRPLSLYGRCRSRPTHFGPRPLTRTLRSEGLLALGRAIAEIRTSRAMSQRQFAASIGCSHTFIEKIELGVRRLDVVEFVALARAMQVSAADLLAKIEEATPFAQKILPRAHEEET